MFAMLSPTTGGSYTAPIQRETADAAPVAVPLESEVVGDAIVVACPGPTLCGAVARRFAQATSDLYRNASRLVIDLTNVTAIDAAGLRSLALLARECDEAGGECHLCGPSKTVRLLLAATGLNHFAHVFPTRRHAVLAA